MGSYWRDYWDAAMVALKCWKPGSIRDFSIWHKSVPLPIRYCVALCSKSVSLTVGISIGICQHNDLLYISLMLPDVLAGQKLLNTL